MQNFNKRTIVNLWHVPFYPIAHEVKGRDHVSRVHFARVFQVLLCYLSVILVSDVRRVGPVLRLYIYLKYCYVFKMLSIHSPKTTRALKDLELSNKFENADISDENQVTLTSLSNYNVWSSLRTWQFIFTMSFTCH